MTTIKSFKILDNYEKTLDMKEVKGKSEPFMKGASVLA